MKKPPEVVVIWTDAIDRLDVECKIEEVGAKVHLRRGRESRGLLVYKDDEKTVLAHDYDVPEENEADKRPDVSNFTVIPSGWITHVRYIERGPRRKEKAHEGHTATDDQRREQGRGEEEGGRVPYGRTPGDGCRWRLVLGHRRDGRRHGSPGRS